MEKLEKLYDPLDKKTWKSRLAQFYDTLAWIYYRKGDASNLTKAFDNLYDHALSLEQESPIIYYHISRVRIAQIERIWQSISRKQKGKLVMNDSNKKLISHYLRDAFIYWRHAHRLDQEKIFMQGYD